MAGRSVRFYEVQPLDPYQKNYSSFNASSRVSFFGCSKGVSKNSSGTVSWYISSYCSDFDDSEVVSLVHVETLLDQNSENLNPSPCLPTPRGSM